MAAGQHGGGHGRHDALAVDGVLFALELTHDVNALLPLLIACVVAHAFTVLVMKRSILTEKVGAAATMSAASMRSIRWKP